MNYLVAVLPERSQAEAAYSALEKEGLSKEQVAILGVPFPFNQRNAVSVIVALKK